MTFSRMKRPSLYHHHYYYYYYGLLEDEAALLVLLALLEGLDVLPAQPRVARVAVDVRHDVKPGEEQPALGE